MDVRIPCICPPDGSRHPEGDIVVLRDTLGFVATQTARNAVVLLRAESEGAVSPPEFLAVLTEQYVLLGAESWTVVGEDDKPLPLTRANLSTYLLEGNDEAASLVADEADGLYAGKVMLPLLKTASSSSLRTPTASSTSPTPGSGETPADLSSPSSISTIPTAATGTTSKRRAGGSSSSRSSTTAA